MRHTVSVSCVVVLSVSDVSLAAKCRKRRSRAAGIFLFVVIDFDFRGVSVVHVTVGEKVTKVFLRSLL